MNGNSYLVVCGLFIGYPLLLITNVSVFLVYPFLSEQLIGMLVPYFSWWYHAHPISNLNFCKFVARFLCCDASFWVSWDCVTL